MSTVQLPPPAASSHACVSGTSASISPSQFQSKLPPCGNGKYLVCPGKAAPSSSSQSGSTPGSRSVVPIGQLAPQRSTARAVAHANPSPSPSAQQVTRSPSSTSPSQSSSASLQVSGSAGTSPSQGPQPAVVQRWTPRSQVPTSLPQTRTSPPQSQPSSTAPSQSSSTSFPQISS
ncbi:MAG: hypothetical protein CMH59_13615 [Myxococcales bacterium]|nr:hypothetical protein [Myxococcales bacterium]